MLCAVSNYFPLQIQKMFQKADKDGDGECQRVLWKYTNKLQKDLDNLDHLVDIDHLEDLECLKAPSHVKYLNHLEDHDHLQHLDHLEETEDLDNFEELDRKTDS